MMQRRAGGPTSRAVLLSAAITAALAVALTVGQVAAQSGGMTVTIGGNTSSNNQDNAQSSSASSAGGQSVGQHSTSDAQRSAAQGASQQTLARILDNANGQQQTQSGSSQAHAPTNTQIQTISATVNGGRAAPTAASVATAGSAGLLDALIRELMDLLDE